MYENYNGNFTFISNICPSDVFEKLRFAENRARTNFRASGHETREVLEKLIGIIIKNHNLENAIIKNLELYKKIEMLRNEDILRKAGYLQSDEQLEDKRILPDLGTVYFKYEDGRKGETDYYDFMRRYGNSCSHADSRPTDIKVDYKHTILCLKGYHLFLGRYYANRILKNLPAFDENIMPIEEYYIYDSYDPADSARSKCIREFKAYTTNNIGKITFYAVLRLYNKSDLNEHFLLRNTDTYTEASKMSISSVPEGMTKMRELIPYNTTDSSFYIISYVFNREPHALTESLMKELSLDKRVKMCRRIADCLYNLHMAEVPIYHRMLNYESIYVCDYGREWVPYIIKFDFAKITSNDPAFTIYETAEKAKNRVQELKLTKYLPPEWSNKLDTTKADWAKMDIYAMGVLFSDILAGKVGVTPISFPELEELDLSEELLDMLEEMRAEKPEARCDIDEVQLILEEEVRRWK